MLIRAHHLKFGAGFSKIEPMSDENPYLRQHRARWTSLLDQGQTEREQVFSEVAQITGKHIHAADNTDALLLMGLISKIFEIPARFEGVAHIAVETGA